MEIREDARILSIVGKRPPLFNDQTTITSLTPETPKLKEYYQETPHPLDAKKNRPSQNANA